MEKNVYSLIQRRISFLPVRLMYQEKMNRAKGLFYNVLEVRGRLLAFIIRRIRIASRVL